jgi:undecaprenyl-diphosphatase
MSTEQIIVIALVQGITEFLPISSSGHLILIPALTGWPDQFAIYIRLATIPAIACGLVLEKLNMPDLERNVAVVAWNTILYATLMLIADMLRPQNKSIADMTLGAALFIGVAQALALIPGTSRSGVTITAGRFLGLNRAGAALPLMRAQGW